MDAVRVLQRLVRAESPSGREGPAARVLMEALAELGLEPRLDEAGNVEAVLGTDGPEVLLTGHMDTVPAGASEAWPHPPFSGEVAEGAVWGRGTVDMKGALAAMVAALARLKDRPLAGRVRFLAVVQEEVGGLGSRYAAGRLEPDAVVLGEPSNLGVMRGHRGRIEVWADFEGRLAHAARAELGHNPLFAAGRFLAALEEFPVATNGELGPASCTPTLVASDPAATNVVPGVARVVVDYRFVPGEDPDRIVERLRDVAGDAAVYVPEEARTSGEVRMTYPLVYPPYLLDRAHPALEVALRAVGQTEAGVWWFTTDAPYLAATGAPVIGYGPGDPALAHTTREHVPVAQVEAAVQGYVRLVEALLAWASAR